MYSVTEINIERLLDRADELEEYIANFPTGSVANAAAQELKEINAAVRFHG